MNLTYSSGGCRRRRQTATANKQHVTAQNTPARPAKTPTIIGVQLEGTDVDNDPSPDSTIQNSPVYVIDEPLAFAKH